MNKERRKKIEVIYEALTDQIEELRSVLEEEVEAFDNLPESFQNGEKGEAIQEYIDLLETTCDDLDSAVANLDEFFC